MLNPYSWGAFVTNNLAQINVGVVSRDILSTTSISAGYTYDLNEGTSFWNAGISYQGLYPILDLVVSTGDRENEEQYGNNVINFSWAESTVEGGVRIPFQLTNSKYSRRLSFGNAAGFTRTTDFRNVTTKNGRVIYDGPGRIAPAFDSLVYIYKDQLNNGDLIYNHFSFSFSNLLKRSRRDFLRRWGQTLDVDLYNTPYGGDFEARQFAAQATFYFPGFFQASFPIHTVGIPGKSARCRNQPISSETKLLNRGDTVIPLMKRSTSFSVNYALPIWYPDIALGPILYIQRIKANCFYDYGKGTGTILLQTPTLTVCILHNRCDLSVRGNRNHV